MTKNQSWRDEQAPSQRNTSSRRVPWAGLAGIWSIFIVLICLAPHNPGPPSVIPLDKLAHFLLFAAFGGLWLRAYPRRIIPIAIAGTLLGLAIEILQSSLGWGRMGDGADLAADCIGLFCGLVGSDRLSAGKPELSRPAAPSQNEAQSGSPAER